MTDRTPPNPPPPLPDEPPPDAYDWTDQPEDPDAAGMPGEYVNDTTDGGVPGVRREPQDFDPESNN
jgi:hypothetical protein